MKAAPWRVPRRATHLLSNPSPPLIWRRISVAAVGTGPVLLRPMTAHSDLKRSTSVVLRL